MTYCTACGTQSAGGAFCVQCGAPIVGARVPAEYRPSTSWLVVGLVAWLLVSLAYLGAVLRANDPGPAYAVGAFMGLALVSLIPSAVIRVGYVAIFHRGSQMWERALYSPWLWCIGTVVDVLGLMGHSHAHG